MTTEEKHKAVGRAIAEIKKSYKLPEDTMVITTADKLEPVEKISSGIVSLDLAMEGGYDCGRFSVISGQVSCGKSTLCLMLIANAQKIGKTCVLVDAEHRFAPKWAATQGVSLSELQLITPQGVSAEVVLDTFLKLCKERAADLVVVDSITSLAGAQEQERTMEQETMGLAPKILSKFFRKAVGITFRSGVCGVLVTQHRDTMSPYAKKIDGVPGGHAIKHYAQHILNTTSKGAVDDGFTIGIEVLKATGPGQSTRVDIPFKYGIGVNVVADMVDVCIKKGMIEQGGGGFYTVKKEITGGDEERIRGQESLLGWFQDRGLEGRLRELLVGSNETLQVQ